jgi:hypothetical protein
MTKEKMFENEIRDFLKKKKIYHWKQWSGNIKQGDRYIRVKSGLPDLLGVLPNGILLGIEVKKENGIISDIQKKTISELNSNNSFCIVVYPKDFELFKFTIEELLENKKDISEIRNNYFMISNNL